MNSPDVDSPELPISRKQKPDEILKNTEEYVVHDLSETMLDALLDNVEYLQRDLARDRAIQALESTMLPDSRPYLASTLRVREGSCAILDDRIQHRLLTDPHYKEVFYKLADLAYVLKTSIWDQERNRGFTKPMAKQDVADKFLKIYNSHKQTLETQH